MNRREMMLRAAALTGGAVVSSMFPDAVRSAVAQGSEPGDGVTWIATTEKSPWQGRPLREPRWIWDAVDAIDLESRGPVIAGFSACFNELGWTS